MFAFTTIFIASCSKPKETNNNFKTEIVTFSLKDTADFDNFIKASNELKIFLLKIDGFKSRNLYRLSRNQFQDVLIWENQASLNKADSLFMIDPFAQKYASFMDTNSINFYYPAIINELKK